MNNAQVARRWIKRIWNSSQGSNFFFEGPTIYSYGEHFPIATFCMNDNGEEVILFTQATYSNSTAKHIGHVRRVALDSGIPIIYVNDLGNYLNCDEIESLIESLEVNRLSDVKRMDEAAAKSLRARKHKDLHVETIQRILKNMEARHAFFGVPMGPATINKPGKFYMPELANI